MNESEPKILNLLGLCKIQSLDFLIIKFLHSLQLVNPIF